ncbi:conserved hypothetical protein [Candidatus Methylobacter favarea]|uniref:Uncharacterized protein n=1 Tax=Candidatus Methylobacter favarea TaxID=2707345 RepID=A0A8S0X770_9GAMM|nr:conserved hypothetical protein [Candidatus Methylobacter favarea]
MQAPFHHQIIPKIERYINNVKDNVILAIEWLWRKAMKTKKPVVIVITLLLLTVSACASSTKVYKNGYQSHPGSRGHPWDKGRSY